MYRRGWVVLAVTSVVLAGLVVARPPITEIRNKRNAHGVKGGNRNTGTSRTGNGCKTFDDGGYECRHSYGYGDTDPFATGGAIDPNSIATSLTARDFGRDLVQAHVAGFEGDKNGCKTFPDGSYECRRGYSYSASTHGWDALQTDPLAASSLLNLHAVNQDLAALRDGTAVFDRNQNGCRTFPDGSWECKRSWGYGSSTESQTALNAGRGGDIGQDYSDVRGGTGTIGRDENGCRTFTDGSWECRRGYSYNAATGWNLVSGDVPAPVSERRSSYNAQSSSQSVQVNRNGDFDKTQRGCRTYADGSWECKPEWGYRASSSVQTTAAVANPRERENIRDENRNVGSRTYSSTQERQEVFRNSGVSTPNVGTSTSSRDRDSVSNTHASTNGDFDTTQRGCRTYADGRWECKPEWGYRPSSDVQTTGPAPNHRERENIRDNDRNVGSQTYSSTQERQEVFRNSGGSSPNVATSASLLGPVPDAHGNRGNVGETPTGCTTLPDGSTECRRGYSYSSRQERNYTSGGLLNAPKPSNREVASRPRERPDVNAGRSSYSYTQEKENIRNGGVVNPVVNVGLDTQVRENVAEVHTSRNRLEETPSRSSYTPQVENEPVTPNEDHQRPLNPVGNVARHEYSYTHERESVRNGGDTTPVVSSAIGLNSYPRETAPESHSYTVTTPRPSSYSGGVLNSQNRGRVYQEPTLGTASRSSYSQTQQREVIKNAARPYSNPNTDTISTHGSEDFSGVANVRVIPSYSRPATIPTNADRDYRTPVVDSGLSGTRSYSYTQEKEVVNHGGIVNPTASRTLGLNSHHSSDLLGTTGSLGGSGCQTNPDGSTVCRRGYSHSSTQEREIYSGGSVNNPLAGRSSDTILGHEEPGMVTVVTNPNARPNKEGCRTLPDGGTECVRGHSETRQWGGASVGAPIINPFNSDGSVNHLGAARLTNTQAGREVEGVKTGRRTSSTSSYSSSSQTHRVGGVVGNPSQNSGRYIGSDGSNQRQSAALLQGSSGLQVGGTGNIAEVHNEEYARSGSSGRGSGCALVAGSPCNRNGQQSGYSYSNYGSTGFRTGTLEV